MPSSLRHSSATAGVFCGVSAKSGTAACARSTNSDTASARAADASSAGSSKRPDKQRVLAWRGQRRAAGRQDAQPRRGGEQQRGELGAARGEVLAGVQDQQQLALRQAFRQRPGRVARHVVGQAERLGHGAGQQLGRAQRRQLNQPAAVREGVPQSRGRVQREPRLADSAGPAQGDKAVPFQGFPDGRQFPPPADEPVDLRGEIVPSLAPCQRGHDVPWLLRPAASDPRRALIVSRGIVHRGPGRRRRSARATASGSAPGLEQPAAAP